MEPADKVGDEFIEMEHSTMDYHQLQPPATHSVMMLPGQTDMSRMAHSKALNAGNPFEATTNNNNNNENSATSSQSSTYQSAQSQMNLLGETNQHQLPSSSTETISTCHNNSFNHIANDRNTNKNIYSNRVTTSFSSESRLLYGSNKNSSIVSDNVDSQDEYNNRDAKKESCPTNFIETNSNNQIASEINHKEFAAKEKCDSSEVIDSDIVDVLPKVINEIGGARIETHSPSDSGIATKSSAVNRLSDSSVVSHAKMADASNNELRTSDRSASSSTTMAANYSDTIEHKSANDMLHSSKLFNESHSNESAPIDSLMDGKSSGHLDFGGNPNNSKTDVSKVQYPDQSEANITESKSYSHCDLSLIYNSSNKPIQSNPDAMACDLKVYPKPSRNCPPTNNWNTNEPHHSKDFSSGKTENPNQPVCSSQPTNWPMANHKYEVYPPLSSSIDRKDKAQLPTHYDSIDSNHYSKYEHSRQYSAGSHRSHTTISNVDSSHKEFKENLVYSSPTASGHKESSANSTTNPTLDLSKPSATKLTSLYISNPDFSKHNASSTRDLSPLKMKPPDFSKVTTQSQRASESLKDHLLIGKNYGFPPLPPCSVNSSNFAEISKKYNYIKDLQLKNPSTPPSSSQPSMHPDSQKSTYNSLYVKTPDFSKSIKDDKTIKPDIPDEPTAHVIHKNQFYNNAKSKQSEQPSLYKTFPQLSQDVTMSIVAPQHQHEPLLHLPEEKNPIASANVSCSDRRLIFPENLGDSSKRHDVNRQDYTTSANFYDTRMQDYTRQKERLIQSQNEKFRNYYPGVQEPHTSNRPPIEVANHKQHLQDSQYPSADPKFSQSNYNKHPSSYLPRSNYPHGYFDPTRQHVKYENSETPQKYGSFNQYPTSQIHHSKSEPQQSGRPAESSSYQNHMSNASLSNVSVKPASSTGSHTPNMQQSTHFAAASSSSIRPLHSPLNHAKPPENPGQMNPPQHWPSQPIISRVSQSPISLSSSPSSNSQTNRISQSPIGASPSPHHGISQSPNYMYASPHATPSPSQFASPSAPSPIPFKRLSSPYYSMPNQPNHNLQYYQPELNSRYPSHYPKVDANHSQMVQIKAEPGTRDSYYSPVPTTDKSPHLNKMPSDFIDLTKTSKPASYQQTSKNAECFSSKYSPTPSKLSNRPESMAPRPEPVSHRADSMTHRPETFTHRADSMTQRSESMPHRTEPAPHRADSIPIRHHPDYMSHRPESTIQRPESITHRSDTINHRADIMSHRSESSIQKAESMKHVTESAMYKGTNTHRQNDGKSDRTGYGQQKTIVDPYLYRHASEADLNYQIIQKTLNKDISIRRSDTDLSRSIFDNPKSITSSKRNVQYSSSSDPYFGKGSHDNSFKTNYLTPYAQSPADVFLQRNPDVKVTPKIDQSKSNARPSQKPSDSSLSANSNHSYDSRMSGELGKHDLSVTVSRISESMTKSTERYPKKMVPSPQSSNFGGNPSSSHYQQPKAVKVKAESMIIPSTSTQNSYASPASTSKSSTVFAPVKRESPLDLSVKTVKTTADSTGCDDYNYCTTSRRRDPHVSPSLKIEFSPNFQKHNDYKKQQYNRTGDKLNNNSAAIIEPVPHLPANYVHHEVPHVARNERQSFPTSAENYDKRSDVRYSSNVPSTDKKLAQNDITKNPSQDIPLILNPSVPTVFGQKPEELKNLPIPDPYCDTAFNVRQDPSNPARPPHGTSHYVNDIQNRSHCPKVDHRKTSSSAAYNVNQHVESNPQYTKPYPELPRDGSKFTNPYYDYRDKRPHPHQAENPQNYTAHNTQSKNALQFREQQSEECRRSNYQELRKRPPDPVRPDESYNSSKKPRLEDTAIPHNNKYSMDIAKTYSNSYGYYPPMHTAADQKYYQPPLQTHAAYSAMYSTPTGSDIHGKTYYNLNHKDYNSKGFNPMNQAPNSEENSAQTNKIKPTADVNYPFNSVNDRKYEEKSKTDFHETHVRESRTYYPDPKKEMVIAAHTAQLAVGESTSVKHVKDPSQLKPDKQALDSFQPYRNRHQEYQARSKSYYNPQPNEMNYMPQPIAQQENHHQEWRPPVLPPTNSDYHRMQYHRSMSFNQNYLRLHNEYTDIRNASGINTDPGQDPSKLNHRGQPDTHVRTNNTLKGADQNVISKLRSNLELKEMEKQKLLKNQISSESMRDEDETNKCDIASLIAARIRTKGELKGFTPIVPIEQKCGPEEIMKDDVQQAESLFQETCSDLESSTTLDLMDWGSACNDFVEQLQGGGSRKRGRRKRRNQSSVCDVKLETVEQEFPLENLPGVDYKCDIDESLVNIVKSENKGLHLLDQIKDAKDSSSSDEDMPLHMLRQQSLNEHAKIKEEMVEDNLQSGENNLILNETMPEIKIEKQPDESAINKRIAKAERTNILEKLSEKIVRNKKEQQREKREQEKRMSITSSSESEADSGRILKRPKKVMRKLRNRANLEMKNTSGSDSSDIENDSKGKARTNVDSAIDKRKKICSSSSESDRGESFKKSIKVATRIERPTITKLPEKKFNDSDGNASEKDEKSHEKKTPIKPKTMELRVDETMTRSKRKRELENQIANSKVLRNDKVVKNIMTPDRKTSDPKKPNEKTTPPKFNDKSKSSPKSSSKLDDGKASDSEGSKNSSRKKKGVRAAKLQTSSSENEQSEPEEILAERLRSRKVKCSIEVIKTPEKDKKNTKSPPKKTTTPQKPPSKTEQFPPGWEEEVYEYKRSLKIPASLITIGRPPIHRKSVSLPDLDPHSSDASETFAENRRQRQTGGIDQTKKGRGNSSKLSEKPEINAESKSTSIIDVLHQRVIRPVKNSHKKSRIVNNVPKLLPQSNEVELLPTPGAEGTDVFKHHSMFETAVLKSRTRKEYRAQKNQEIIREVFGCDDRPASAPPEQTMEKNDANEIKPEPVTFDQKYKQYLEKMNIDFGEKIRKLKNFNKTTTLPEKASNTGASAIKIPEKTDEDTILNQDDETQDTEINECERNADDVKDEPLDSNERDTPSVLSERDGMTPNSLKSFKIKKARGNRSSRRKGSSGFDYIRKKKKPLPQSANTNGLLVSTRRREAAVNFLQEKDENDINREIRGWVLNKGVGESVLHKAARLGYVDVIAFCLERMEMTPDQKDNAGYTPLHEACSRGRIDIARLLLMYGAYHSETAHSGIRPLHEATENGYIEIVRLLLSYGADPLLATYSGQTPIMLAENDEPLLSFLKNYLQDIQNTGPNKLPWRFKGPWSIYDPDEHGYNVFEVEMLLDDDPKMSRSINGEEKDIDDIKKQAKTSSISPPIEACDSNFNVMCLPPNNAEKKSTVDGLSSISLKSKLKNISTCTVVLNNIDTLNPINSLKIAAVSTTTTTISKEQQKSTELKCPDNDFTGVTSDINATYNKKKSQNEFAKDCGSESDGDLFEFEESELPHVPLYHLRDEGAVKWAMLNDICYLLKVKSKDTLLKQICSNNSSSNVNNKELLRELKMSDFLEKATCLQLLCAGEKLNIRSSKVVLVKYNESVKNLLGVKTVLMRF